MFISNFFKIIVDLLKVPNNSILKGILFFTIGTLNFTFPQGKSLKIYSPLYYKNLKYNSEILISWHSHNIPFVNIAYSVDEGNTWKVIKKNIPSRPSSIIWETPSVQVSDFRLKIYSSDSSFSSEALVHPVEQKEHPVDASILSKINELNNTVRIMPLGDSITEGIEDSENQVGYRRDLDSLLTNIGINFDFVGSNQTGLVFDFDRDNEGHGGWHAKHKNLSRRSIADSLYKWLENASPDVVLLHIGTNDIGELDIFNETTEDVVSDIEELLDIIDLYEFDYSTNVFVFLAQIIKRIDDPSTTQLHEEDSTIAFNNRLETLFYNRKQDGDNIALVNHENVLDYYDDLPDGVHPNDAGYKKMANKWFQAIAENYNYSPIILQQPCNIGTVAGNLVKFKISISGLAPIGLQWYKNTSPILGENDSTLILDSTMISDNGATYYCSVFNSIDTISSDTVSLFVTSHNMKVKQGLISSYSFEENEGTLINDSIIIPASVNLNINEPATVNWINHGLKVNTSTLISNNSSTAKIYEKCTSSNEITVEAWIKPTFKTQSGPARIVTFSKDGTSRNFTLAQDEDRYSFRLRTTETSNNGIPDIFSSDNSVDTVLTHIVFTRDCKGKARFYLNGKLDTQSYFPGKFTNWDSTYSFGIGNEFTTPRPWQGIFYQLSVFDRALDSTEVVHNFNFGEPGITDILKPSNLEVTNNIVNKISLSWIDNSDNEDGFIIERSTIAVNNFNAVDSTIKNAIVYTDNNINEGLKYYYRIKSFSLYGKSQPSDTLQVISKSNVIFSPSNLNAAADTLGNASLNWSDNSTNEFGYIIERRPDLQDSVFYVIDSCSTNSFVDTIPKFYSVFEYRVKAYNFDKESSYSNIFKLSGITNLKDTLILPNSFSLKQNFPNPFNPTTKIVFNLESKSVVNLDIFNSIGEKVSTLVREQTISFGEYSVDFNPVNLPSGVYFYKIAAVALENGKIFNDVKKMILLK